MQKKSDGANAGGGFAVLQANVAGIDLGGREHWVCGPGLEGEGVEVKSFGATTTDLMEMAQWLQARGVQSVALESTGVYWIAPHEVLEAAGFEVVLVDTRQLARVPARYKTDVRDCRWLQRLHSCGLLRGSFRPADAVCVLRTLVRDRQTLTAEASDWLRRMQKSLDQMNVRVHRAVTDIDGVTGMAIVRAIVAGERDPAKLAQLRQPGCRKTEAQIARELTGNWRGDHLFSLRQSLRMYDAIQERIADYDAEIRRQLDAMASDPNTPVPPHQNPTKARTLRKQGGDAMRDGLYRICGADVTSIDSIGLQTALVVLSEYGPDLRRFPTEKQFVAHANLAPRRGKSAGKPVKRKPNSASTRVAAALRMAAVSLRHSHTALGGYYRSHARRLGADVAVFATARKLATLVYRLLRYGQAYVDQGAQAYELRYQQLRQKRIEQQAKELGFRLVPLSI